MPTPCHVSSNPDNVLGNQLGAFITRDKVHVVAMSGSYFRGDSARVEADLCQQCVKELIGPFCHVLPAQD